MRLSNCLSQRIIRGSHAPGRPLKRELTLEEKNAKLEAQNALLRAENELLKKIRFMERRQNKG
jgi:transposase-like protein